MGATSLQEFRILINRIWACRVPGFILHVCWCFFLPVVFSLVICFSPFFLSFNYYSRGLCQINYKMVNVVQCQNENEMNKTLNDKKTNNTMHHIACQLNLLKPIVTMIIEHMCIPIPFDMNSKDSERSQTTFFIKCVGLTDSLRNPSVNFIVIYISSCCKHAYKN